MRAPIFKSVITLQAKSTKTIATLSIFTSEKRMEGGKVKINQNNKIHKDRKGKKPTKTMGATSGIN
jgi:hypothetical protein